MRRDIRVYVQDMQVNLTKVGRYTDGRTEADYHEDSLLRHAVERVYEIIAEILKRMIAASPETLQRIPDAGRIISFRNLLAHEYDKVDDGKVWEVTAHRFPVLKQQIDAWAAELGMEAPPEPAS